MNDKFSYLKVFNGFAVGVTEYGGVFYIYLDSDFIAELIVGDRTAWDFRRDETVTEMLEGEAESFWTDFEKEWKIMWFGNPDLRDDLRRTYGDDEETVDWLYGEITDRMDKEYFSYDPRFKLIGNPEQEEKYDKSVGKGWYGSFDETIQHPKTGQRYMIGFKIDYD